MQLKKGFMTKKTVEAFIEEANLTELDEVIFRMLAKGDCRNMIADVTGYSISTIDKRIKHIKQVYEAVQEEVKQEAQTHKEKAELYEALHSNLLIRPYNGKK